MNDQLITPSICATGETEMPLDLFCKVPQIVTDISRHTHLPSMTKIFDSVVWHWDSLLFLRFATGDRIFRNGLVFSGERDLMAQKVNGD